MLKSEAWQTQQQSWANEVGSQEANANSASKDYVSSEETNRLQLKGGVFVVCFLVWFYHFHHSKLRNNMILALC